ncbi:MAG: hypothetical protein ACP5NQ_07930 [Vulcanisaeta sp.]
MKFESVVKYANVAYAGIMIGLAIYFIVLIKYGYIFLPPSTTISLSQVLSVNPTLSAIMITMIVATITIVLLNMVYEMGLKPMGTEAMRRRQEEKKGKGKR